MVHGYGAPVSSKMAHRARAKYLSKVSEQHGPIDTACMIAWSNNWYCITVLWGTSSILLGTAHIKLPPPVYYNMHERIRYERIHEASGALLFFIRTSPFVQGPLIVCKFCLFPTPLTPLPIMLSDDESWDEWEEYRLFVCKVRNTLLQILILWSVSYMCWHYDVFFSTVMIGPVTARDE